VRWPIAALFAALCCAVSSRGQELPELELTRPPLRRAIQANCTIQSIEFAGLRRIARGAVLAQMRSREGDAFDPQRLSDDVRTLARLGWFRTITVEKVDGSAEGGSGMAIRLRFLLEEEQFLVGIKFEGSRDLSPEQIGKLLSQKQIDLRTEEPENEATEYLAAVAIRSALEELGQSGSRIQIERQNFANATVSVHFVITDGDRVPVGRIRFVGESGLPEKLLLAQMREIRNTSLLAGLGGQDVFTRERYEDDRKRLLDYYQDHGYPEARIGMAEVSTYRAISRSWMPWRHEVTKTYQSVVIPVEAGRFYEFETVRVDESLRREIPAGTCAPAMPAEIAAGKPYSEKALNEWRRAWYARLNPRSSRIEMESQHGVDLTRRFDGETGRVDVEIEESSAPPIIIRKIEFEGLHRFSDRFVRRRLGLVEGRPFDERVLERGLARVSRTGYFRPLTKSDVRVETDEAARTMKISIHLQEIGKQRISLTGGQSSFGETIGIAYSVFDLLNREELLSGDVEDGAQSAFLILGLAKEGIFAENGALAVSLFDTVVRPRLSGTVKGPFFTSRSTGLNAGWTYTFSEYDSMGVNYSVTRSVTDYSLGLPEGLTGLIPTGLNSKIDSRAVGANWRHDSGRERAAIAGSVSGGILGGDESVLRGSAEYAHIFRDPFFSRENAWAFRTTARAVGSYSGDLPLYQRMFSGDELVRGLREGELGPYAIASTTDASGNTAYSASPAGTDLATAMNAEYRVRLRSGLEGAGFFDLGSGWLLPNWLGQARPILASSSNGILHGTTGVELRWTVPGVEIPVRTYYSVSVLRLDRWFKLPGGSFYHARNRRSAFGWALGALF